MSLCVFSILQLTLKVRYIKNPCKFCVLTQNTTDYTVGTLYYCIMVDSIHG